LIVLKYMFAIVWLDGDPPYMLRYAYNNHTLKGIPVELISFSNIHTLKKDEIYFAQLKFRRNHSKTVRNLKKIILEDGVELIRTRRS
jgi:hypothetical protein